MHQDRVQAFSNEAEVPGGWACVEEATHAEWSCGNSRDQKSGDGRWSKGCSARDRGSGTHIDDKYTGESSCWHLYTCIFYWCIVISKYWFHICGSRVDSG